MKPEVPQPMRWAVCAAAAILATSLATVSAHRVDEFLQAAQVTISPERVELNVYLTPGTAVVPAVVRTIDRSGNGQVSTEEEGAYADAVLSQVSLSLDGVVVPLELKTFEYPDADALAAGRGSIRLTAVGAVLRPAEGEHLLTLDNRFRTAESVYLANAMVSRDPAVTILGQERDGEQTRLTIRYRLEAAPGWRDRRSVAVAVVSLAALTLAAFWFRQTGVRSVGHREAV